MTHRMNPKDTVLKHGMTDAVQSCWCAGFERDELIEEDRMVASRRWDGGLEEKELILVNKCKFIDRQEEVLVLDHTVW